MPRPRNRPTWSGYKKIGRLHERHVQMAIDLGMTPDSIEQEYATSAHPQDLLLLEWVEDRFFAKHGHYSPICEETPESQAEHPAKHSLLPDPWEEMNRRGDDLGEEEDSDEAFERAGELRRQRERQTPVSCGEIHEEDQRMLQRQAGFRKAAEALTHRLATMPEVQQVTLFGSVALPLWKELSHNSRLRQRRIRVYHQCANIDLAVWVTSPANAKLMRQACCQVVNDLIAKKTYCSVAPHTFCIHLVLQEDNKYLGMVCHYNKCPKHKPPCEVPGCGAHPFVQVLPWFRLKPERLNSLNSQRLFQRNG